MAKAQSQRKGLTVARKKTIIPLRPVEAEKFYIPERDGVTFSLLSTFLDCREKARRFLQGWSSGHTSFALVFGGLAHRVLQMAYDPLTGPKNGYPDAAWVGATLDGIEASWRAANPTPHEKAEAQMMEAIGKASVLLPVYFRYWKEDFDTRLTEWVAVEKVFRVPYTAKTRAGKTLSTFLRGRRDGLFSRPGKKGERLLETKTKTNINEDELLDTLPFSRQVNLYLITAMLERAVAPTKAVLNLIRKPQLRQGKKETWIEFLKRIEVDVVMRPAHYFMRMELAIDNGNIDRAGMELEDLVADFLTWWTGESGHYKNDKSCIVYNMRCDYLRLCGSGGTDFTGLVKREAVFRELEDD